MPGLTGSVGRNPEYTLSRATAGRIKTPEGQINGLPGIDIVVVCWGDEFVHTFLNFALPSHLGTGNLDGLAYTDLRYEIYTTPDDIPRIEGSAAFAALKARCAVRCREVKDIDLTDKYRALSVLIGRAILKAAQSDRALLFLPPDSVYAGGAFAHVRKALEQGKRAVMVHEPRVDSETFARALSAIAQPNTHGTIDIAPAALAQLAVKHPHARTQELFASSEFFSSTPGHIYWPIEDRALLVRSYHLHPLMVWPQRRGLIPSGSIDFDFTRRACPNLSRLDILTDSTTVFSCQLSEAGQFALEHKENRLSPWDVALWSGLMTTSHHRAFARHSIRIGEAEPRQWREAEHKARLTFRRIRLCRMWFELLYHLRVWRWPPVFRKLRLAKPIAQAGFLQRISARLRIGAFILHERYWLDRDITRG